MKNDKGKLLPFYLVVDVSFSMSLEGRLDAANRILPAVLDALTDAPILSDKVRFALIDFSGDAQLQLPLCDLLGKNVTVPQLSVRRTGTSYSAAFRLLRHEIEANVKQLKADGFAVHRPAVFFLSDGEPTDTLAEWKPAFADLTRYDKATGQGFPMYPNFVPCGVADADPRCLQSLIHPRTGPKEMKMYLMDEGQNPADAISSIAEVLISSMLESGMSMADGGSGMFLPRAEDVPRGVSAYSAEDYV